MDGVIWHNINYQMCSPMILNIMSMFGTAAANQMPGCMEVSNISNQLVLDDLSKMAPHKQENSKGQAALATNTFLKK
jgi:hypothetical protein